MHTDEELNVWGDRFAQAGLRGSMRFEQFMALAPALRQHAVVASDHAQSQQQRLEARVPDLCLRGDQLIEPLHHTTVRASDRPVVHWLRRAMK